MFAAALLASSPSSAAVRGARARAVDPKRLGRPHRGRDTRAERAGTRSRRRDAPDERRLKRGAGRALDRRIPGRARYDLAARSAPAAPERRVRVDRLERRRAHAHAMADRHLDRGADGLTASRRARAGSLARGRRQAEHADPSGAVRRVRAGPPARPQRLPRNLGHVAHRVLPRAPQLRRRPRAGGDPRARRRELADPLGSARSHGCIRIDNAAIDMLARDAVLRTPVQIS